MYIISISYNESDKYFIKDDIPNLVKFVNACTRKHLKVL